MFNRICNIEKTNKNHICLTYNYKIIIKSYIISKILDSQMYNFFTEKTFLKKKIS